MEESQDQAFMGAGTLFYIEFASIPSGAIQTGEDVSCTLSLYLSGRHCRCVLGPARDPARSAQTGGGAVMQVSEEETRLGLTGPQDLHQFLPLG